MIFNLLMIYNLISIFLLSLNQAHPLGNCPNLDENIYFVGNTEDFDYIGNCTHLNSSLFITGDYNVNELTQLSNLEIINGYLVILDSHLIRNLKGIHNLQQVRGDELYLKTASVIFKYNNNFLNDENRGLCFTDLINWTKITPHSIVDTKNGINCPEECHPECLGCFGPGPRLCQECRHSKVGNTCVNFDCDKHNCSLSKPTKKLTLDINRNSLQDLNITWPQLSVSESKGNIQAYKLFRDNKLIYHDFFDDSGYTTRSILPTFWLDKNLTINKYHFYTIEYFTENGSISSDEFQYNLYDWNPADINNLQVEEFQIVSQDKMNTKISFESLNNSIPYKFIYSIIEDLDFQNNFLDFQNNFLDVESVNIINIATLENLKYLTHYWLKICGYNIEYDVLGKCSIVNFTTFEPPTITSTTRTSITTRTSTSSITRTTTSTSTSTKTSTSTTTRTSTSSITRTTTSTSTKTSTSTTTRTSTSSITRTTTSTSTSTRTSTSTTTTGTTRTSTSTTTTSTTSTGTSTTTTGTTRTSTSTTTTSTTSTGTSTSSTTRTSTSSTTRTSTSSTTRTTTSTTSITGTSSKTTTTSLTPTTMTFTTTSSKKTYTIITNTSTIGTRENDNSIYVINKRITDISTVIPTITSSSNSTNNNDKIISTNSSKNIIEVIPRLPTMNTFKNQLISTVSTTLVSNGKKFIIVPTKESENTNPKILNIINQNNNITNSTDNNTIITYNDNDSKDIPIWMIILIIFSSLLLIICLFCIVGNYSFTNNEISPEKINANVVKGKGKGKGTLGYNNDTMIVTQEFTYQEGCSNVNRTSNPLYDSGSSLDSISSIENHNNYEVVNRPILNNPTYLMVNGEEKKNGIINNKTYGYPEVISQVNSRENQSGQESNYIKRKNTIRPTSDYRDINKRRNSQEFSINPSLKNYRPTIRKDNTYITDESIGRRKGSLMKELQNTIHKKNKF